MTFPHSALRTTILFGFSNLILFGSKFFTNKHLFFIILDDEPLFEGEYTPIGKVIYGMKVLEKIRYSHRSEYVLRPDFINTVRMFK